MIMRECVDHALQATKSRKKNNVQTLSSETEQNICKIFEKIKLNCSRSCAIVGNPGVTHSVPTTFILGNRGVIHSVPTAFMMNAAGTEWVTPGLPRMELRSQSTPLIMSKIMETIKGDLGF